MHRLRFEWFENNFVFLIYSFVPHITQNLADGSSFAPQFVQNLVVPLNSSSVNSKTLTISAFEPNVSVRKINIVILVNFDILRSLQFIKNYFN